ncbi:MAG TPA: M15 family metallopeptidase [Acetivibrio sp.]|uniref:M15 family metallopeptidase n=1 Tax=Acetivibrio sp. TaxID=1872092 RepID=UPI002CD83D0A|nr:M15 family metallopeptidase [Acetivibrio sp.]HOM03103.1 M15 family metallopeptidase [Acetivibrio sp.]
MPASRRASYEKGKNNNLPNIKFFIVILAVLILFTSCVSDGKPATTSNMVVTLSPVSSSATPSKALAVTEPSTVIEPTIAPDSNQYSLPDGFVYVTDVIPTAQLEIRYFSNDNFTGTVIDGYEAPKAILTEEAAYALKIAADALYEQGYYIKIFDAYRPQRAVNHFVRWAQDLDDAKMKEKYYPELDKSVLFKLGYIAEKSGHSRGSTVDLTLAHISTGEELDMGSGFDFFGEISNHGTHLITPEQEKNRNILRDAMVAAGFEAYTKEWWHYKLKNEPYPDTYFDFPVN